MFGRASVTIKRNTSFSPCNLHLRRSHFSITILSLKRRITVKKKKKRPRKKCINPPTPLYTRAVIADEPLLRAKPNPPNRNQWSIRTVFGMLSEQAVWNLSWLCATSRKKERKKISGWYILSSFLFLIFSPLPWLPWFWGKKLASSRLIHRSCVWSTSWEMDGMSMWYFGGRKSYTILTNLGKAGWCFGLFRCKILASKFVHVSETFKHLLSSFLFLLFSFSIRSFMI